MNNLTLVAAQQINDLPRYARYIGGRQINLIQDRNNCQILFHRQVNVRQCLRLNSLASINHQYRTLASLQTTRNFIAKIDMPRSVNQIQIDIFIPHSYRRQLNSDAFFPLQIH